jgi:phosphate transport system permease protein
MSKTKLQSLFLKTIVYLAAILTAAALVIIIVFILLKGIPHLSLDMFKLEYNSENLSLFPAMINTVTMTLLSLLLAVPLGIFAAVYLAEYSRRNSAIVKVIRTTAETLSGIPSIIYGLFGYLMFVVYLGWGYSMLAGAFTLSIMILPVIMRTTEEALNSVDSSYREGSFGLGAGKLRTVFKIVLPAAVPGIAAGVVLSVGRIVGETAALIYTAGTVAQIPENLMNSGRTMSIHLYALWKEGLHSEQAYATAVVLLVVVIFFNALSAFIAKRITKGKKQ